MKNLRNRNAPPDSDLVQVYLRSSWDIVTDIYKNLPLLTALAEAVIAGDLDGFLEDVDIDTIAKLNAILTDATLGDFASQAEAEAGTINTKTMTPLRVAQAIAVLVSTLLNKYDGTVAPGASDDGVAGYSVGSYWIDIVASPNESYRCTDNSTGAAVWIKTTLTSDELAVVALTGDSDDLVEGVTKLLLTVTERATIAAVDQIYTLTEKNKLAGIAPNATIDQSDSDIETAYGNQVAQVSAGEKTAGTELAVRRFAPKDVADMAGTHSTGISDAPSDGTQYARKDAAWEAVAGGGGGGLTVEFKTASFTAVAGKKYLIDSTTAPVVVTLPAGTNLDNIILADVAHYAGTNNITVNPNGAETIDNDTVFVIDQNDGDIDLGYNNGDTNWEVSADGSPDLVNVADFIVGRRTKTFFIDGDMRLGNAQNPGAEVTLGTTGGNTEVVARPFDDTAVEYMVFSWVAPDDFDESWGIAFIPIWSPATTSVGDCEWELRGRGLPEGDSIDQAYINTGLFSTDAGGGVIDDVQYGPEAANDGGLLLISKGNLVIFRAQRRGNAGTDTLTGDANLIGYRLVWKTDQVNEDIA